MNLALLSIEGVCFSIAGVSVKLSSLAIIVKII